MQLSRWLVLAPLLAACCYGLAGAQNAPARRKSLVAGTAPHPKWTAAERATFFANAADQLGPEPAPATVPTSASPAESVAPAPAAGDAWSAVIPADVLESEIKALAKLVEASVKSPNEFKGGGFKTARRDFTTLSALFGVIAQYDGEVRWKAQAGSLRDAFGRAGKNCKVGTDGTYAESKRRSEELAELIQGSSPSLEPGATEFTWSETADRPPLMERLEIARTERLKPWSGSKAEFTAHQAAVEHEAALVAALSRLIRDPSYDFADDTGYIEYVTALQAAAADAHDAAVKDDFARLQAAVGLMGQSCDKCHGDYR